MLDDSNLTKNSSIQRIRLHISYDGTSFFGWQKQPDKPSIQESLEKAILSLTTDVVSLTASGRTDAGVHALMQVVHFDFDSKKVDRFDWVRGLNRFLPSSIRVRSVFKAPDDFHALRSSIDKTYLYKLQDGETEDPLFSRFSHWVPSPVDLDYMRRLSESFLGNIDFASYMTQGTPVKTTVRDLKGISWRRDEVSGIIEVKFTGNGFLKQMVRNLMGTFLHGYWEKRLNSEEIKRILELKSRQAAHGTAPASGLTLLAVKYPVDLDNKCLKL